MGEAGQLCFHFPLPLLAYGPDPKSRLHDVVNYCVMMRGWELVKQAPAADVLASIRSIDRTKLPTGFLERKQEHQALALGMQALCVQGGSVRRFLDRCNAVAEFVQAFTAKHGKQPYVSIGNRLVWEVIGGSGISWREFSVLCGLYSWIGGRRRAWVTRSVIQRRALGYKSAAVMESELSNRTDGEIPLTLRQLNYTLDRLHERAFFARVRKDHWHTYYSLTLNQDCLENALIQSATYDTDFHSRRVMRNRDFMARLKAARAGSNVDTPNVDTGSECSRSVHVVSTLGVTEVSTIVSTLPNSCTKPFPLNPSHQTLGTPASASQPDEDAVKRKAEANTFKEAALKAIASG